MYDLCSKETTSDRMWSTNDSIKTGDTNDPNNPQKKVNANQTIRHSALRYEPLFIHK